MRIAMMTNNYKPVVGGVPISIERLSGALRERGHDVTVFAPHHSGESPEPGVIRYKAKERDLPGGVVIPNPLDPVIQQGFAQGNFDLIHVHHPMMIGYAGMYLSRKYRVPMAFTYHTRYEQYLHHVGPYAKLERRASDGGGVSDRMCGTVRGVVTRHNKAFTNRCDLVFAPTPLMRGYLREHGTKAPIAVLPTGLGAEDFAWDEAHAQDLRACYLGDKEHLFCSVSRLEQEKNLPFLLRAMARYKAAHGDSFRLLLIGSGTRKEALEQQAADLGLAGNVLFMGEVEHRRLADYYRACDAFVFASRSETQGIVLLEAMAAGLPVVAVEASGVCDVVENGVNGWSVEQDEGLFARWLGEVAADRDFRGRLRLGASRTAAGCTAAHMAATAEGCYSLVLRDSRAKLPSGVHREEIA